MRFAILSRFVSIAFLSLTMGAVPAIAEPSLTPRVNPVQSELDNAYLLRKAKLKAIGTATGQELNDLMSEVAGVDRQILKLEDKLEAARTGKKVKESVNPLTGPIPGRQPSPDSIGSRIQGGAPPLGRSGLVNPNRGTRADAFGSLRPPNNRPPIPKEELDRNPFGLPPPPPPPASSVGGGSFAAGEVIQGRRKPPTPTPAPVNPPEPPDVGLPPAELPPGAPGIAIPEAGDSDDARPLSLSGKLKVDLIFDLGEPPVPEKSREIVRKRAAALVFAINSLNNTNKKLLTVGDLIRETKPKKGLPTFEVKPEINLSEYLSSTQLRSLEEILEKDKFVCGGVTEVRTSGVRADVFVNNVFGGTNYNKLMGLTDSRTEFEAAQGIEPEFDANGAQRARFTKTKRWLVDAGESGILHDTSNRTVIVQQARNNLLVIRTGDISKEDAKNGDGNFKSHPGTAKVSGSEEIWELPNGMRGWSARDKTGKLLTVVPPNLVHKDVTNTNCITCHGSSGYIATTMGELSDVDVDDEKVGDVRVGKKLFNQKWADYPKEVEPANDRFENALKQSGGNAGELTAMLAGYEKDVSLENLALESKIPLDKLRASLDPKGNPKYAQLLKSTKEGKEAFADNKLPKAFTRGQLATSMPPARSAYCALREQQDLTRAPGRSRDAVTKGNPAPRRLPAAHGDRKT